MNKRTSFLICLILFLVSTHCGASNVVTLPHYSMKYSVETTASKKTIWHLWSDVENWKMFDERLEFSYLINNAAFEKGAIGTIKGNGAPKTPFELIKVDQGKSFTEVLKLPLYQTVHLQRYFEPSEEGKTIFTHKVSFKGRLKSIYYALFGSAFKKDLPLVMEKMKEIAEEKEQEESLCNCIDLPL